MGRILLGCRLVLADLRRRPVQATVFLLTVGIAATALAVGLSVSGATGVRYEHTRAVTGGPDVVVQTEETGPADLAALDEVADRPEVTIHSGPHLLLYASVTAHGREARVVVEGRRGEPDALDQPLVTSGGWLREGGVVVERGFAEALGVRAGERITVAGKEFPVAGIAVTAAHGVYPGAEGTGPYGGPSNYSGLVWLSEVDAQALSSTQLAPAYAMHLRLVDPGDAPVFRRSLGHGEVRLHLRAWQDISSQDAKVFRDTTPALIVGGWLLAISAVTGAAVLAAARADGQTRRAGLLKAVGATPAVVTAVLLAEYLVLGLVAAGLGLVAGQFATPLLAGASASLLDADLPVTFGTALPVLVLAVLVALASTAGPSVRAARSATVPALVAVVRSVDHAAGLTALAGRLPVPLLLGLRLVARRPRRALLSAASVATAGVAISAALALRAQPSKGYDLGGTTLTNLRGDQTDRTVLAVTAALLVLAAVNTLILTWSTALDARRSLAVARAFGATPGQVTAALAVAQLPAAAGGAAVGLPLGLGLVQVLSAAPMTTPPPAWWLLTAGAGLVLLVAASATVPAVLDARRPVTPVLGTA
ncbi:FtsX-like permease family protein [Amycolatopsis sp. 195334CR]|uniref:FtsX-like permease family protein n=1 Tax=Amycolatopsis sp. 195334CR TaxID=2814588 RepID=UPI001A8DD2DB|nr:FtsX-like permease family protein [Amycolatopsis sp. 195334CR]MBN6033708.1 FtsX-like permease family protein [Amycolatopsis sp. 195334CR]